MDILQLGEGSTLKATRHERTVTFLWQIPGFSTYTKTTQGLRSPPFSTSPFGDFDEWFLVCWPFGNNAGNCGWVSCELFSRNDVKATYVLWVKDPPQLTQNTTNVHTFGATTTQSQNTDYKVYTNTKQFKGLDFNIAQPLARRTYVSQNSTTFLPKDILSIYCKITLNLNDDSNLVKTKANTKLQLSDDLGNLLDERMLSDVDIIGRNCIIPANRCILSARSEVFRAMFSHSLKEREESVVRIDDMEDDVLQEMVRYMYTGTSPNLPRLAQQLIPPADKYNLQGLKDLSELQMIQNLTAENFCVSFNLANLYRLERLKRFALDFARVNMVNIVNSSEFDEMLLKPDITKEIFLDIAPSMQK